MHEAAPLRLGGQTGITAPPAVKSSVFPNFRKIDTLFASGRTVCAPSAAPRYPGQFSRFAWGYACVLGESRALPRQCKNGRRVPFRWRYGARAHPYGQWGGLDGVVFIARLCLGWKLTEDIWGRNELCYHMKMKKLAPQTAGFGFAVPYDPPGEGGPADPAALRVSCL